MTNHHTNPGTEAGAKAATSTTASRPSLDSDRQRFVALLSELIKQVTMAVTFVVYTAAIDISTGWVAWYIASFESSRYRTKLAVLWFVHLYMLFRHGLTQRLWRSLRNLIAKAGPEDTGVSEFLQAGAHCAGYTLLVLLANNLATIAAFAWLCIPSFRTVVTVLLVTVLYVDQPVRSITLEIINLFGEILPRMIWVWNTSLYCLGTLTRYFRSSAKAIFVRYYKAKTIATGNRRPRHYMQPYSYEGVATDEIRLLRVTRKGPFGNLECRITYASISALPLYEALSYTWGGLPRDRPLTTDDDGHVIKVTKTVIEILEDRASSWDVKLLWIDSVCINQVGLVEKASQIKMMGKIYSGAERTVIWLGQSPDALLCTAEIARLVARLALKMPGTDYERLFRVGSKEPGWEAFLTLLDHPYWSRVWIVQEICFSRMPVIAYGGRYLKFSNLEVIFQEIIRRGSLDLFAITSTDVPVQRTIPPGCHLIPIILELKLQLHSASNSSRIVGLQELLHSTKIFQASDPKDLVFGFLSLLRPDARYTIDVDYTLTPAGVCLQVGRQGIIRDATAMIAQAGIGFAHRTDSLPSWCPDFTGPRDIACLSLSSQFAGQESLAPLAYCASGSAGLVFDLHEESNVVQTELLSSDTVAELGAVCVRRSMLQEKDHLLADFSLAMIESARSLVEQSLCYDNPATWDEVVWRTLIGNRNTLRPPTSRPADDEEGDLFKYTECVLRSSATQHGGHTQQSLDFLRSFYQSKVGQEHKHDMIAAWCSAAWNQVCQGRRLALTARGALCLVPEYSMIGDVVGVLRGGQSCVVMRGESMPRDGDYERLSGSQRTAFRLVGESYVHGFMDGEALRVHPDSDSAWVAINIW